MPRAEILAGRNLLTERPVHDKRFSSLSLLTTELAGETNLVGITYDTRHTNPATGNPILILAGDVNKKLYFCDSVTMDVIEAFDYPAIVNSAITSQGPVEHCFGIATMNEPTDCLIAFLSEKQIQDNPVLYYLRYDPNGTTPSDRLTVDNWHVVDMSSTGNAFNYKTFGRGLSEYHNDLLTVGMWKNVDTIVNVDYMGMPLAYYPAFTVADKLCGVQHINGRIYTTIDMTSDPDIGSRVLAKFLTEQVDRERMIPLMSIEPFFLPSFDGEITIFQDRMAACYADNVYTFRMCYFMFIVDGLANDDIDMGSILIGDSKTKRVVLKNIADIYQLKDVSITVDKASIVCPGGASNCPAKEAADWVTMTTINPEDHNGNPNAWQSSITLATSQPYIQPDGEREFWVKVEIPTEYANLTLAGGTPRSVTVDDGPFVVPLVIRAKVG